MKFNIYPIKEPSIIESLYDELCEWVGFVEDENRMWWVAYKDCEPMPVIYGDSVISPCFYNTHVSQDWAGFAGIQLDKDSKHAMMTPCEVKPEFRGHGLQKKFLQVREDWCRYNGYLTLNSLTLTDNIYSINNLIACGYRLRKPFYASNGKGLYWEKKLG
jgi:GNAT superfamily N-acetyltransferase